MDKRLKVKVLHQVEETIRKVDGKYVVYPKKGGDRLGTHDSESGAKRQLAAIEISKSQNEGAEEDQLEEKCQKGYKTHHKRKTKVMFGKDIEIV